ncbi:MAG: acyclic terpene utilization AtuA family protein [Solirubrobacteraceae bacterium]
MSRVEPLVVANCSGYYGDRASAAREMLDGGPVDVLTGDYLAELTMLILWKTRQRRPGEGYARTFLAQMEEVLGTCLDRGVKVVANAGGLNPAGLAEDLATVAQRLGLHPRIAHIEGDDVCGRLAGWLEEGVDLRSMDSGQSLADVDFEPITANVYLGAWGIVEALRGGADVVICPRVTDASVVVGPAAWAFGWERDDWDALAGAVIAGHLLECGAQVTGGNYSFFTEIADPLLPGFPIAEIAPDGSCVITKHPGTPGAVSRGTVTAQLLYEIDRPAYRNPDVTAHFDSVTIADEGADRVRLSGQRGSPPPDTLKVCVNYHGGFRNSYTCMIAGLDIEAKARFAVDSVFAALGGAERFESTDVRLVRSDHADAATNAEAVARLTITVKDRDGDAVGRRFAAAVNGIGLAIYPGNYNDIVSPQPTEYGVMWPTLVPASLITQRVVLPGGEAVVELACGPPPGGWGEPVDAFQAPRRGGGARDWSTEPTRRGPLGALLGARSGDKGANANVGVWARSEEAFDWLAWFLTPERVRILLPETAELTVERYELANVWGLNFVVRGILGQGVAATTRPDAQAKSLGEFLRSRVVDLPRLLLDGGGPGAGAAAPAVSEIAPAPTIEGAW